ncbi:MAG TPA: ABC transporter ATP-binding protein [Stellaceae bacterium]|nr:ABC transporter ATP-binding protein [Stellaceae bacterium]
MAPEVMLEVTGLHVAYGSIAALKGVDLEVLAGEFVAILGPNGAGKSTLIKAVMGVHPPKSGTIRFGGHDLAGVSPAERIRLGIGIIPEGRQLFPDMTVRENLVLGAYAELGVRVPASSDALDRVFAMFPRLAERQRQLAGTFSGGEAQMLAIGRALMTRPRLLLCDEPSLGLAPGLVRDVLATLSKLRREHGVTVTLADQNAAAALRMADRGYVLDTGYVVAGGDAASLQSDERLRAAYLGTGVEALSGKD